MKTKYTNGNNQVYFHFSRILFNQFLISLVLKMLETLKSLLIKDKNLVVIFVW